MRSYSTDGQLLHAKCGPSTNFMFLKDDTTMPQSSQDSKGGKSHPVKDSAGKSDVAKTKTGGKKNPKSPTGPHTHGEKKTTP